MIHLLSSNKQVKNFRLSVLSHSVVSDSFCQAPLSMGFSRQEYWGGYSSPEDLPKPGIEPRSLALQADSLPSEPPRKPKEMLK